MCSNPATAAHRSHSRLRVLLSAAGMLLTAWAPAAGQAPTSQEAESSSLPEAPTVEESRTVNFLGLDAAPLTEPLVTDRPDFTESAVSIPRGHMQIESGYTYTHDHEDGVTTSEHAFPEILLRVGLFDDFELRIGWAGGSLSEELFSMRNDAGRTINVKEHDDGPTDMSVGFKYHFFEQKGWRPEFGVIAELSIPTGTETKSSGDVDPIVKFLWSYDLSDRFGLAGNVNLSVPTSDNDRFFQTAASVSLSYAITDQVGSYIEYFGFYPDNRDEDCVHSLNGGLTYQITDNLQWDIRAGFGLNEQADDLFAGTGFAIRF